MAPQIGECVGFCPAGTGNPVAAQTLTMDSAPSSPWACCAFGAPLPRAQPAGEEELSGAGSGLGEDGFEVVAGGVFGHHHALRDLACAEAFAEQREDF